MPGVDVGDVRLHHVLHQLREGDLRHPAEFVLRLRAVALFDSGYILENRVTAFRPST